MARSDNPDNPGNPCGSPHSGSFENLYIHVPFCAGKCDYCAFYSEPEPTPELMRLWLEKVLTQIRTETPRLQAVKTIYFGGGTPTLLPCALLESLFTAVHEAAPNAEEISTEANPFTVTREKAAMLTSFVNRVSLGIQTFRTEFRIAIGRHPHEGPTPAEAVANLRAAGLRNLGLDLMYGLPGQTWKDWIADLEQALTLAPEHISAYSITPEPGTPYANRTDLSADTDELQAGMWEDAEAFLSAHGLMRYEISNSARPGFEARHNVNIWHGQTYLGLGPAATSFDGFIRWTQVPHLRRWLDDTPPEIDRIPRRNRLGEILMMGLRTVRGWTADEFAAVCGGGWETFQPALDNLADEGLLEINGGTIRPTKNGLLFWNDIAESLVLSDSALENQPGM